ncbi:MAG: aminotransferase class V-fold PLP-dependent enzyme [Cypionkella sp.]|nr:aminotransferase class V-fold PLP-dependent enzyme [Cypionkella sp.]
MQLPHPHIDPDGLQEFSVVFTDRSLNHMSARFQAAMREISTLLKSVYNAEALALIPGGGSYGMEAVARQFGQGRNLVVRNGWFSYRWTQIFDACQMGDTQVVMAQRQGNSDTSAYAPPPIETVVARIFETRPNAVFAPHVETSAGIILPDDYIKTMAAAAHEVGALMVLDCIASGTIWVDMAALGVDVLISAPQKGWSASPSAGVVMLSAAAEARLNETTSNSFAIDLKKWRAIMAAYEGGGHAYHATMPTDAIMGFHAAILETQAMGFDAAKAAQYELGRLVREDLAARGVASVAAKGFGAPGVVVSYTSDANIQNGSAFRALGLQIAAGVPLQVGEGEGFRTFRLGLFGLDKLRDPAATLARLTPALDAVLGPKS